MIGRPVASVLAILAVLFLVAPAVLAQQAVADEWPVDDRRAAAAGVRKIAGRHLVLYTDLPPAAEIDTLPAVFDRAVPQWCAYFGIDEARARDWRVRGFLIGDRRNFDALGLMPAERDDFAHGLSIGNDIWVHDQSTPYYRRHLLLHEGTHAFMSQILGGCGPGWYMEGMAELLGTHRWVAPSREQGAGNSKSNASPPPAPSSVLELNIMPRDRREVPMLGRIKLIRDAFAADGALGLPAVMQIDNRRQLGKEAYAWCWAAAKFLDSHPRYRERFRSLRAHVQDPDFNEIVRSLYADDWAELTAEWQAYVAALGHGYDFERMAIEFERGTPLSRERRTVTIRADRGWQSAGVWLEAGKKYRVSASGRYQVVTEATDAGSRPWMCEPGGVTIKYHDGKPLGILLGAVVGDGGMDSGEMTFAQPLAIGLGTTITPRESGTLYLRVNDSAGRLDDNRGALTIEIDAR